MRHLSVPCALSSRASKARSLTRYRWCPRPVPISNFGTATARDCYRSHGHLGLSCGIELPDVAFQTMALPNIAFQTMTLPNILSEAAICPSGDNPPQGHRSRPSAGRRIPLAAPLSRHLGLRRHRPRITCFMMRLCPWRSVPTECRCFGHNHGLRACFLTLCTSASITPRPLTCTGRAMPNSKASLSLHENHK
jgi:hypothetical protein